MNEHVNWDKMDRIADEANRAPNLAEYLANVWGDLTHSEGTALLHLLDRRK